MLIYVQFSMGNVKCVCVLLLVVFFLFILFGVRDVDNDERVLPHKQNHHEKCYAINGFNEFVSQIDKQLFQ